MDKPTGEYGSMGSLGIPAIVAPKYTQQ